MSVNKYNASTGELTNIASGQRTWVGTRAAYDAAKTAGTLPNNCLIIITDDETAMDTIPTEDSPVAVTSGGLYNILTDDNIYINYTANIGNSWTDLPVDFSKLKQYKKIMIEVGIGTSNTGCQTSVLMVTDTTLEKMDTDNFNIYNLFNGAYANSTWYAIGFAFGKSTTGKVRIISMVQGYSNWKIWYINITGIKH